MNALAATKVAMKEIKAQTERIGLDLGLSIEMMRIHAPNIQKDTNAFYFLPNNRVQTENQDMDVFEAIQKRRSVRAYSSEPVPREALERVLEAGRLAPSASNVQPWHFIVVTDKAKREALAKGGRYASFIKESPVVIVGLGDADASPNWYRVDVTIALENMVLTATSEGLGTCWIGSFEENQAKELLKIPENFKIVALLSMGYPRGKMDVTLKTISLVRKRKKLEEIASFEEYGKHP